MPHSSDALGPAVLMRRVQQLQQLEHPASAVNRFCRQVPSSLTLRLGSAAAVDPDDLLARLSDLAFGYRATPRGLARRAPSAGAMYPIEVAWITHDGSRWVFRYFDALRRACIDAGGSAQAAAEELELAPGQHALLLMGVAWRTIQRYGLRGYRYCLLDAGNVLGNVASVVVASGAKIHLPESVPHALIHQELNLSRDELLLVVAVIDGELSSAIPALGEGVTAESFDKSRLFGTEQAPMLAPSMERIRRLHRLADPGRQHPLDFSTLLGGRGAEQAVEDIELRRSARSFLGTELSAEVLGAIDSLLVRTIDATPAPVRHELEVRMVTKRNDRWQAKHFDQNTGGWTTEPIAEPEPDALISMFGDQPLAAKSTAFAVLGMRGKLGTHGDPLLYRQVLLTAGLACAGLYHLAVGTGVATTTFGGFDDRRISELANGEFRPVVVQAFGNSSESAQDEKNDTVAATWFDSVAPAPYPES
jgi:hypothetical protein